MRQPLRSLSQQRAYHPSAALFMGSGSAAEEKPRVIFVLGGPGAGKGTQCEMLARDFEVEHLSAGELLRQERLQPSETGRLIDAHLREGSIVPVEISLNLLRKAMEAASCSRFLIDGFPRNHDNLQGWERLMSDVCSVDMTVFIDCNEGELQRRILNRGKTSGRNDDNEQTARKRLLTFQQQTMPVIDLLGSSPRHYNLVRIDGNLDVQQVNDSIKKELQKVMAKDAVA
ncbi:adenylate kinase-domain-containing protein [Ochromonadaceae sp. CCMP2298]|nr:adenylate kinase-domain-containing protein [Ochromonadaceae sp. CCMP2298]|eukprot:CAMPEP_0173256584 /NCGR_PEP_ID=MMETSP1142-20121109/23235_1 /TAXON_ID=483371 /ORGANISM="non described non described, Strain CCMP2298" /LENGTH=228 /DNA_ID=CAMNT_0014190497 /DNA_START=93 /DNA_END=779 /DNA_ORIENTATION=-